MVSSAVEVVTSAVEEQPACRPLEVLKFQVKAGLPEEYR